MKQLRRKDNLAVVRRIIREEPGPRTLLKNPLFHAGLEQWQWDQNRFPKRHLVESTKMIPSICLEIRNRRSDSKTIFRECV